MWDLIQQPLGCKTDILPTANYTLLVSLRHLCNRAILTQSKKQSRIHGAMGARTTPDNRFWGTKIEHFWALVNFSPFLPLLFATSSNFQPRKLGSLSLAKSRIHTWKVNWYVNTALGKVLGGQIRKLLLFRFCLTFSVFWFPSCQYSPTGVSSLGRFGTEISYMSFYSHNWHFYDIPLVQRTIADKLSVKEIITCNTVMKCLIVADPWRKSNTPRSLWCIRLNSFEVVIPSTVWSALRGNECTYKMDVKCVGSPSVVR